MASKIKTTSPADSSAANPAAGDTPGSEPVVESRLDVLVKEKMAAGLPKADAVEVAKAQIAHDEELAAAAAK